jgi:hypothetical protein
VFSPLASRCFANFLLFPLPPNHLYAFFGFFPLIFARRFCCNFEGSLPFLCVEPHSSAFSQLLEITLRAQNQYSNFTTFMNLTHFVSLYAWE